MSDDRIALLEKIIYIQSCVLEGHSIKAMIRKESRYFREESGAQVIAVCVENEEHIDIELVLEEKKKFLTLIRKHRLTPKRMNLKKFIELCHEHFARSSEYIKIESLHDIFRGTLSKKSSADFAEEMGKIKGYPVIIDGKYYSKKEGGEGAAGQEEEGKNVRKMLGNFAKKALSKKSDTSADEPAFAYYTELLAFSPESVSADEFQPPAGYKQKEK